MDRVLRMKRVYDPPAGDDGHRVLVDRLWPRGLAKEAARVDEWPKEVTPSTELRKWYHEDPDGRRDEFTRRYLHELDGPDQQAGLARLWAALGRGPVTLLTSAKDVAHSHVPVLVSVLEGKPGSGGHGGRPHGGGPKS
ncbi:hypothetical protein Cs7R123_30100 [Catellatospora sp. TT07R-123]|uniref:DUF488 domain-containing protein n=1 Tax=Catellatospora sp. TT07R-123 TaxID=2733863 RepID=UPI001B102A7C|nr:DUF488 family protein [Catellatospora sp. TT07R-123]GHJ45668.1 hypothetical protein Cs7R123_30100 [Catellatospora sp. TT07R-123]